MQVPGVKLRIHDLHVQNEGWSFKSVSPDSEDVPEKFRIRGYVLEKKGQTVLEYTEQGTHAHTAQPSS